MHSHSTNAHPTLKHTTTNPFATHSKKQPPRIKMAPITTFALSVTFLLALITSFPRISGQAPTFSSVPTMADCGTHLLSLAPCGPFVQGSAPAPTQQCCNSLALIYNQEPSCLCLFLSGIALRSLPFNASLALDLPGICSPQMSPAICSGAQPPPAMPTTDPVVTGMNSSSSSPIAGVPATPTVTVTPIPSTLFGFGQSNAGHQLNRGGYLALMLALTNILFMMKEYDY